MGWFGLRLGLSRRVDEAHVVRVVRCEVDPVANLGGGWSVEGEGAGVGEGSCLCVFGVSYG